MHVANIISSAQEARQNYLQWKRRHDLRVGQLWNVDVTCRVIKTTTTYIFVFELKNLQLCSDSIPDASDFTYKVQGGKNEMTQAQRYVPMKNTEMGSFNPTHERFQTNSGHLQFTEKEVQLLTIIAEIFQQQEFFDAENKQKAYEEDKSETFKTESIEEDVQEALAGLADLDAERRKENSNSDIENSKSSNTGGTSSTGRSNSIASNADSFKQGGIEENLTGLPNKVYLPRPFKRLRISAMFMIALSMISTIVVLVYDFIFNSELTTSIKQQNLLHKLDGLVLKDYILLQLVYISYRKGFNSAGFRESITPEFNLVKDELTSIVPQVNFANHMIGGEKALQMVGYG